MSQTTASLELYSTRKIKKVLNTSIKELSTTGEYDYLPVSDFTVLTPFDGERFYFDSPIDILWSNDAPSVADFVSISYNNNLNDDWKIIADNVPIVSPGMRSESGSYSWMPDSQLSISDSSDNYRIRVSSFAYGNIPISGITNGVFTITTRSLMVAQNIPSVIANKGNRINIQWDSDGTGDCVGIQFINDTISGTALFDPPSLPIQKKGYAQVENKYRVGDIKTYSWQVDDISPSAFTGSIKIYDYERPDTIYGYSNNFDVTINYITITYVYGLKPDPATTTITSGFYGTQFLLESLAGLRSVNSPASVTPADWFGLMEYLDIEISSVAEKMNQLHALLSLHKDAYEPLPGFPTGKELFVSVGDVVIMDWASRDVTAVSYFLVRGKDKVYLTEDKITANISTDSHLVASSSKAIPIVKSFFTDEYLPCKIRIEMNDDSSVFAETQVFKILSGSLIL